LGWGGSQSNNRQEAVIVHSPEFCDTNFPQVFCSGFDSRTDPTCASILGSPLTCNGDDTAVAGFLITADDACTINGNRYVLNYHSVVGFQEWINDVSAAQSYAKMSIVLILSVILVNFTKMM
jgi:hypothetical protein